MDADRIHKSSSDRDLEFSQCRRNGVNYANFAEFLASLNVNDTALDSVQGLGSLSIEDYLKAMHCDGEKKPKDGEKSHKSKNIRRKSIQEVNTQRQMDSKCSSKSKLISQYTEKIWM
ncbi:uncharacterized protein LOC108104948 [Drosophila eugracilis]|uniref:uncharacterized protein LOC108104948 n=1 Tax=Drosophila eugracilis TaxID=29029 RepID=UPI0007E61846|nr:uncharacterized protein LOC108104948 [Drosophila eugracilis]